MICPSPGKIEFAIASKASEILLLKCQGKIFLKGQEGKIFLKGQARGQRDPARAF